MSTLLRARVSELAKQQPGDSLDVGELLGREVATETADRLVVEAPEAQLEWAGVDVEVVGDLRRRFRERLVADLERAIANGTGRAHVRTPRPGRPRWVTCRSELDT